MTEQFEFSAPLWRYPGAAAWYFVTLPLPLAAHLQLLFSGQHRGWRSIKVQVSAGDCQWSTSLFRDSKSQSYLLPIKAQVRRSLNVDAGAELALSLLIEMP